MITDYINFNYWFLQTVAMLLTCLLIPKLRVSGPIGALTAVISLGFVNATVWDAALFFSIPNSLTTQAGLLFVTNGLIFWILVKLLPGIEVEGILAALAAPVIFTVCSVIISIYGKEVDWLKVFDSIIGLLQVLRDYFNDGSRNEAHAMYLITMYTKV